ncbi:MAG: hypothetical protein CVV64_16610 [Candidatus Wallbacteria bacterium HGW-Wallbacteria-1]|uniref:Uncharacterized protein n=1 Tax=Candidatus Wallbacteria bacterium HGW-Wallbacteria-1 TaxID=2013854 RepID=A0A2N1PKT5_9BACT|nr:MAG: hypothetical protein CVV64_16610 [Candidatus Wallbacteria bacterium HGW-Wallbacteria-1]
MSGSWREKFQIISSEEDMTEELLLTILGLILGISGWVLPYEYNILKFRKFVRDIIPERFNKLVPKIVGTLLILMSSLGLLVQLCIDIDIIPLLRENIRPGYMQFAYRDQNGAIFETTDIPMIKGIDFGWTTTCEKFEIHSGKVKITFPEKLAKWDGFTTDSDHFEIDINEFPNKVQDLGKAFRGVLGDSYQIPENGLPEGKYLFEITIEGKKHSFSVNLYQPKNIKPAENSKTEK